MRTKSTDRRVFRRIASETRPFWPHCSGLLTLQLASIAIALLTPIPLKLVIDHLFGGRPLPAWLGALIPGGVASGTVLAIAAPALIVAIVVLSYLQGSGSWLLQTYTAERIMHRFRLKLLGHAQRLPIAYHDSRTAADSVYRIQHDAGAIHRVVLDSFLPLLTSMIRLASMFWVTASIDMQLAWIALGVSPVLFVFTQWFRARLRRKWGKVGDLESSVTCSIQEVLGSLRTVKAFGQEEREHARFDELSSRRIREFLRVAFLQGGFDVVVGTAIGITTALTLYVAIAHVQAGTLTIGELTLVSAYIAQLLEPLKAVSRNIVDLQSGLASADRAFALLDHPVGVVEKTHGRRVTRANGDLRFEHVTFAYEGKRPTLKNLSVHIPAGSRVGITGRSGSGKSTLINLLPRFYDPTAGRVLLDGVDLREYRTADLRNQFSIVPQEPVLFATTVAENIAYGTPGASMAQVIRAAKLADAHDFILRLQDGYDTVVGERGLQLSGGERQRIALARAFLRDAPILILDEPTSAMDHETERGIIEVLERLMEGRTTLMIAHRLSTLDSCDLRLHLEQGTIAELEGAEMEDAELIA